ncbi:MAG: hypothetical protein EBT81_12145, partial [Gammaproteobacteria bacterium]|nr:hypothetical protein [Gammaproteobacteria bacterium]
MRCEKPILRLGSFSGVRTIESKACLGWLVVEFSALAALTTQGLDRRVSVAPMMDWTDRHCRYFLRGFSPDLLLYTEMVTASAILRGDREKLLEYSREEHPVALQLGGCEPDYLAAAARYGEEWGYDEINLNCGCPSDKVQKGSFGACLMNEPDLVADCVAAMCEAVDLPVTVKMRIGTLRSNRSDLDEAVQRFDETDYDKLCDFMVAVR